MHIRNPSYKISKAALNMLTVQYSISLRKEGFTVIAISPGVSNPPPNAAIIRHPSN